jgi:hypothetical protein
MQVPLALLEGHELEQDRSYPWAYGEVVRDLTMLSGPQEVHE